MYSIIKINSNFDLIQVICEYLEHFSTTTQTRNVEWKETMD